MTRSNKYNNRRVEIHGHKFDSQKEADRYLILYSRVQSGEISSLEIHPRYEIQPAFTDNKHKKHRAIYYEADFEYMDNDYGLIVEDVKGFKTAVFKIKMKMFLRQYPFVDFKIVK